jgi:Flp pilus assembly protein CpaB
MAMITATRDGHADTGAARPTEPRHTASRPVIRRGVTPNGRAVAGGLLVTIAVLGLFAAYRSTTRVPTVDYLIARRLLPAGRVIGPDDLALAPMLLHPSAAGHAFTRPSDVIGKVAVIDLDDGALIQRDHLAERAGAEKGRRLAIELEPAQALNGRIEPGDRVDVVATPTGGSPASIIQRDALVTHVDGLGDGDGVEVGGSGARVTVTLVVPDEDASRRIVDARAHGTVTLIGASALTLDAPPEEDGAG